MTDSAAGALSDRPSENTGPNRYNELVRGNRGIDGTREAPTPRTGAGRENETRRSGFSRRLGDVAAELDDAATEALLSSNWNTSVRQEDSFATQAERVSTFVGIARELGVDPSIGVMQANFGTPQENGLIDRLERLERLEASGRDDTDEAAKLRESIKQDAAAVNPGSGGFDGWEIVDLDVNRDGVVDAEDLDQARAAGSP